MVALVMMTCVRDEQRPIRPLRASTSSGAPEPAQKKGIRGPSVPQFDRFWVLSCVMYVLVVFLDQFEDAQGSICGAKAGHVKPVSYWAVVPVHPRTTQSRTQFHHFPSYNRSIHAPATCPVRIFR